MCISRSTVNTSNRLTDVTPLKGLNYLLKILSILYTTLLTRHTLKIVSKLHKFPESILNAFL